MRRIGWILLAAVVAFFAIVIGNSRHSPTAPPGKNPPDARGWLIVPVAGIRRDQLIDSWHDARDAGARLHEALDIPAPAGTPVVSATDGRVEKLFVSRAGGNTVYVRSDDGKWIAYYAHLQRYADRLAEGQRVTQGAPIGFVGDSGDAGAGNFHLHFALQRMQPGERWWQGTPVNPYRLLAGPPLARDAPSR